MVVPLVSVAQVRILSEGLAEPWPPCELPTPELAPKISFHQEQIRKGLPPPGRFRSHDLRGCHRLCRAKPSRSHRVFFEMP